MSDFTYYTITEVLDFGPYITKVILDTGKSLAGAAVTPGHFKVAVDRESTHGKDFEWPAFMGGKPEDSLHGTRTVSNAYISDRDGMPKANGTCITLEMECSPTEAIGSVIRFDGKFNVFVNVHYTVTQLLRISTDFGSMEHMVFDHDGGNRIIYGEWLKVWSFEDAGQSLNYVSYIPDGADGSQMEKMPLIIWLHGAGEGGQEPLIAAIGNKAVNLFSPAFQKLLGGKAAFLAPQCPTMWMNDGTGAYTTSGYSMYTEVLERLIGHFISTHPCIDRTRVYIGGCSNGGYMTMKMLLCNPDRYAAAFPICEALADEAITEDDIRVLSQIPIWFTHAKNDPVVLPERYVLPTYRRLLAAGAKNIHLSYFDNVIDTSGLYKQQDGSPFEYMGHWSWIYMLNNECTLDFDGNPVMLDGKETSIVEWIGRQQKAGLSA